MATVIRVLGGGDCLYKQINQHGDGGSLGKSLLSGTFKGGDCAFSVLEVGPRYRGMWDMTPSKDRISSSYSADPKFLAAFSADSVIKI